MSIFVVISPMPSNTKLQATIKEKYPNDYYELHQNQWLVSSEGTTRELSEALGINDKNAAKYTGPAIVFAISSYWGRANTDIWEWLKVNWEKSVE